MQLTVKDRQSLPDIALLALGSLAGVFSLAVRNGLSVTAALADGQTIDYELEDVVSDSVRSAYSLQQICPATDIDPAEYRELLYQTGTRRPLIWTRPPLVDLDADDLNINKLDEVIGQIANNIPVKPAAKQQFTRVFDNPFSEIFS